MSSGRAVLHLQHPADNRLTLRFITNDKGKRSQKASQLSDDPTVQMTLEEETIDGDPIYLLYSKTSLDIAYPDFESEEALIEWLNREFSDDDRQILFAVIDIFHGIIAEKEEQDDTLSIYKEMELEKIPEIINRVQWRQTVPEVGAELLSYFILAHPMSNTNHRTAIGLLDRYLGTYEESFVMPQTGEEGRWFEWARGYIYDSKRILTLRNQLGLLYWANEYGYDVVERKEGIQIDLSEIDLERNDHRNYYTKQHLNRSREFVDTVLEEAGAEDIQGRSDDGKRAFADRLRAK